MNSKRQLIISTLISPECHKSNQMRDIGFIILLCAFKDGEYFETSVLHLPTLTPLFVTWWRSRVGSPNLFFFSQIVGDEKKTPRIESRIRSEGKKITGLGPTTLCRQNRSFHHSM